VACAARFRDETTERAFVLRVAHNRGLNHLWRKKPVAEVPSELPDPSPAPDTRASERQQAVRLYAAIRLLSVGYRQVLTLALEELSHAEIGSALGLTPENVAVRLGRARAELRKRLEERA
jgi:RNA polymerase sigma-70 factor (ECF subfamily)